MSHGKIDELESTNLGFRSIPFKKKYDTGIAYLYQIIYNLYLRFQLFYFKHACLTVDSSAATLSMMAAILNFPI